MPRVAIYTSASVPTKMLPCRSRSAPRSNIGRTPVALPAASLRCAVLVVVRLFPAATVMVPVPTLLLSASAYRRPAPTLTLSVKVRLVVALAMKPVEVAWSTPVTPATFTLPKVSTPPPVIQTSLGWLTCPMSIREGVSAPEKPNALVDENVFWFGAASQVPEPMAPFVSSVTKPVVPMCATDALGERGMKMPPVPAVMESARPALPSSMPRRSIACPPVSVVSR